MSQPSSESHPQMPKFIFSKCCPGIFLNYDWGTFHPIFLNLTSCAPCDLTDLQLTCEKLALNFGCMCVPISLFCILSGMKEDDICELLKFERKMLRARISTLRNDKFIQVRLKMETGMDGKAQKVNYYFINYKVRPHILV